MSEEIKFDEETERLIRLGCEKLKMSRQQLLMEALKHTAERFGIKV